MLGGDPLDLQISVEAYDPGVLDKLGFDWLILAMEPYYF